MAVTAEETLVFIIDTLTTWHTQGEIDSNAVIDEKCRLVGDLAIIDSRSLVELLIGLEQFAEEHGGQFDWSSDAAMSATNSPLRTPRYLAAFLAEQSAGGPTS